MLGPGLGVQPPTSSVALGEGLVGALGAGPLKCPQDTTCLPHTHWGPLQAQVSWARGASFLLIGLAPVAGLAQGSPPALLRR